MLAILNYTVLTIKITAELRLTPILGLAVKIFI